MVNRLLQRLQHLAQRNVLRLTQARIGILIRPDESQRCDATLIYRHLLSLKPLRGVLANCCDLTCRKLARNPNPHKGEQVKFEHPARGPKEPARHSELDAPEVLNVRCRPPFQGEIRAMNRRQVMGILVGLATAATIGVPAASAHETYPRCEAVAVFVSPSREVLHGQDNCTSDTSEFAALWFVDRGPRSCASVYRTYTVPRHGLHYVRYDAFLGEPVCFYLSRVSGRLPDASAVAGALSVDGGVPMP